MILDSLALWEQVKLSQGRCPDCERQLLDGIRGSAVINIECGSCGAVFSMVINFGQDEVKDFLEIAG